MRYIYTTETAAIIDIISTVNNPLTPNAAKRLCENCAVLGVLDVMPVLEAFGKAFHEAAERKPRATERARKRRVSDEHYAKLLKNLVKARAAQEALRAQTPWRQRRKLTAV